MNIHPIFVHFPIALLTVYGFLELLRFRKLLDKSWFSYVKGAFVIIGSLTSSLALQTGELAEQAYKGSETRTLIEIHASWAGFASTLFAILAIIYASKLITLSSFNERISRSFFGPLWQFIISITDALYTSTWFMMAAAFIGIVAITVTGALGGAIVYGPDVDPIVKTIHSLLVR